jgi:hypothetical protein
MILVLFITNIPFSGVYRSRVNYKILALRFLCLIPFRHSLICPASQEVTVHALPCLATVDSATTTLEG